MTAGSIASRKPRAVDENHPVLSAILAVRHRAASNFTPEFSGAKGEAYDHGVMDCYKAVEAALSLAMGAEQ